YRVFKESIFNSTINSVVGNVDTNNAYYIITAQKTTCTDGRHATSVLRHSNVLRRWEHDPMVSCIIKDITNDAYNFRWINIDGVYSETYLPRVILVLRLYVVKTYN